MNLNGTIKNIFKECVRNLVGEGHPGDWRQGATVRVFKESVGIEFQLWRNYGEFVGLVLSRYAYKKEMREAIDQTKLLVADWEWTGDFVLKCKTPINSPEEMRARLICLHALVYPTLQKFYEQKAGENGSGDAVGSQENTVQETVEGSASVASGQTTVCLKNINIGSILGYASSPEKDDDAPEPLHGLFIPHYQRGYCWKSENVTNLFESFLQWFEAEKTQPYYVGALILKEEGSQGGQLQGCAIVDGQQRLLTIAILLKILDGGSAPSLLENKIESGSENRSVESIIALKNAQQVLSRCLDSVREKTPEWTKKFAEWVKSEVIASVIIIPSSESVDLAYTFFNSTNATGMRLSDFDLLKTHHLRYLVAGAAQAKAADCWNGMSQRVCTRGNGTPYGNTLTEVLYYSLFRLRHWSRRKAFDPHAKENDEHHIFKHFSIQRAPIVLTELAIRPRLDSILSGGAEFFSYVEYYRGKMELFDRISCVNGLMDKLDGHSGSVLFRAIKAMLFMYYCKFGEWHLKEALFCIAYRLSTLRQESKVCFSYYKTSPVFSECATVLDQATLSGEFFAWALELGALYRPDQTTPTKRHYWGALKALLDDLINDPAFALHKEGQRVMAMFQVETEGK